MLLARRGRQAACALFQPVCSSSWMSIHTSTECMAPAGRGRGGGIPSRFSTPGYAAACVLCSWNQQPHTFAYTSHRGGDGKDVGKDDSVTRLEDAQFRDAASTTPLADEVDRRDADHQRRKSMLGVSRERREQMAHREHPHRYVCVVSVEGCTHKQCGCGLMSHTVDVIWWCVVVVRVHAPHSTTVIVTSCHSHIHTANHTRCAQPMKT